MLKDKFTQCEQMLHPEKIETRNREIVSKKFSGQSQSEVMLAVEQLSDCFFGITNSQVLGIEGGV